MYLESIIYVAAMLSFPGHHQFFGACVNGKVFVHDAGEHSHSRLYAQDTDAKSERHMWRGARL